ncbi:MAG: ATP-binding protein, partial [Pygmaiobacter sp.]
DVFGECRTVAAKIHQLVRNGARYNEIAVICRDMERYAGILKAEFDARNIPSFADTNTTAEYTAPAAFLRAALELAKNGLASRALLALLKTDLCGIPLASAAALENYVFVWQPKAADWRAAFVLNPAGFGELRDEDAEQLALAEAARSALVPKVEQFLSQMARTDGAGLAKSLYLLLDSFSAPEQLCANAAALRAENPAAAEDALRSWDLAMDALDTMSHLLGQDSVTPAEFDELLLILLRGSEVGNVPRTLDAVTITGADRMRLAGTKYSFVLGLCEGEFPRNVAPAGLLTQGDRDFLERSGIELPGSFENRVLLEQMFFYRALTSASTLLCMSAPSHGGGEIKLLSSDAAVLLRALSPPELCVQNTALYTGIPAALAGLAAQYTDDTPL